MGLKSNKVHISGENPVKVQRDHGVEVVETYCERLVLQGGVIPVSEYRAWVSAGRTLAIFCKYCRREVSVEEEVATMP